MPKILVVEDEEDIWRALLMYLKKDGYEAVHCGRGDQAVAAVLRDAPDLVILDMMLPGKSGIDVLRELRAKGLDVPVIVLTARSDEIDRVLGLEMGADDYVTKPFSVKELIARVRARLRRDGPRDSGAVSRYAFGDVEIDFDRHEVRRAGARVDLGGRELDVLKLLVRFRGQVISRERMLRDAWGYDGAPTTRTVDSHIFKLRQKLEDDAANPRYILSVYGEGYKFVG
jgi:two-component system alkaline phosphatase synthesis response regulator PhoP